MNVSGHYRGRCAPRVSLSRDSSAVCLIAKPPVEIRRESVRFAVPGRVSRRRRRHGHTSSSSSYVVVVAPGATPSALVAALPALARPLLSSRSEPAEPIKKCSAASEPPPPFRQRAGGTPRCALEAVHSPRIAAAAAPLTWRSRIAPRSPSVAVNRRYSASPN